MLISKPSAHTGLVSLSTLAPNLVTAVPTGAGIMQHPRFAVLQELAIESRAAAAK